MPDLTFDGMMRVAWAPVVAAADGTPTVAELTASVDLTPRLTPDGLDISADTSTIDTTKMNSTSNSQRAGRRSYSGSITYIRSTEDDEDAAEVQDVMTYRAAGYLIVRRDIAYEVDWAAAQKAEVYQAECGAANPDAPGPDTNQTVNVPLLFSGLVRDISDRATITA
jgi:hypothetical protein